VDDIKQRVLEISKNCFALITDKAYLKYYRNLHKKIADSLDAAVFEVESDVCVSVEIASNKQGTYAFEFRREIYSYLDRFIIPVKPREPKIKSVVLDFGINELSLNNPLEILNTLIYTKT
jgi:deoxyribodipyrimidine photo-lyase